MPRWAVTLPEIMTHHVCCDDLVNFCPQWNLLSVVPAGSQADTFVVSTAHKTQATSHAVQQQLFPSSPRGGQSRCGPRWLRSESCDRLSLPGLLSCQQKMMLYTCEMIISKHSPAQQILPGAVDTFMDSLWPVFSACPLLPVFVST